MESIWITVIICITVIVITLIDKIFDKGKSRKLEILRDKQK